MPNINLKLHQGDIQYIKDMILSNIYTQRNSLDLKCAISFFDKISWKMQISGIIKIEITTSNDEWYFWNTLTHF